MFEKVKKSVKRVRMECREFCINWGRTLVMVAIFAVILNTGTAFAYRGALQHGIAEEVIRFHVLANSDSEEDQRIKYMVRDTILQWMQQSQENGQGEVASGKQSDSLQQLTEKEKTERFLVSHLGELTEVANQVLQEQGVFYTATASLEECYFPDRTYGDCTFPAGWYEALRIQLGEAKGHNWWCVLYPNLCFSDCLHAVVEEGDKEELKEVLTAEEYESLLHKPEKWKISFRWF